MLPNGKNTYKSFLGSVLSLLTLLLLLFYAGYKLDKMVSFSDYKIQTRDFEDYFDSDEKWGHNDEFALAAGVSAYDGSSESIEDLSIGQVKFYRKAW